MSFRRQSKTSWRFECMVNGRRFSKTYKSFNETKSEVQKKFEEWKRSCGEVANNTSFTFKEFADIWIEEYCKEYSPIVTKHYVCNLKNWLIPEFGNYYLEDITPLMIDRFINRLKGSTTKYKNRKNAKLSNGTIEKLYGILHAILTTAYMKNVIEKNPCERVRLDLRRELESSVHCWETEDYKKALRMLEAENNENTKVIEFALKTGLRRSEIFGLTFDDVDFEQGIISVNKSRQKVDGIMTTMPCKTKASIREIYIPQSCVDLLREYKKKHPENKYIFENIDYDCVTHWFRKWQKRNNLPQIRFHDLRHTHASLLLAKQVSIKTISERLGHSNIGITMNTYTHVFRELDKSAADVLDKIVVAE